MSFRTVPGGLVEVVSPLASRDGARLSISEVRCGPVAPCAAGGPAFLLVHGFGQNRSAFLEGRLPAELVARGARVFVGELRGHGRARAPGAEVPRWTVAAHLEDGLPAMLAHVRGATGVERVHLVGHSMGGMLGYALLGRGAPLASLLALGAPLRLGARRPHVRVAAAIATPLVRRLGPDALPIHRLLAALSGPLSAAGARGAHRAIQVALGLASPAHAAPERLRAVLAGADPESPEVFVELARMAATGAPSLAGVDLVEAVRGAEVPVAAVVGSRDVFAPRAAVAPLEEAGHRGPRRVVELPGGAHVDLTLGHHLPALVSELWPLLVGRR